MNAKTAKQIEPQPEQFTVDYFIQKFEAIPEEKWCVMRFHNEDGQCCVMGHCGMRPGTGDTPESLGLEKLFGSFIGPVRINNGHSSDYCQPTPRLRTLAALQDLKAKGVK